MDSLRRHCEACVCADQVMIMLNRKGLFTINASEADNIVSECEHEGWRIFRLPNNISSKDDFFAGVRRTLPLDPELRSNRSWDALADSLWAGLDSLREDKIIVIWPDPSLMEAHAQKDFFIAESVLSELSLSLADAEMTAGAIKQLLVLRVI